jgi:Na+:H+ antiporter
VRAGARRGCNETLVETLYIILIVLFTVRLFGELAERVGQPALVGELLSGLALGVLIHGFAEALPTLSHIVDNDVFGALTNLAIFFLMLLAGVEMHPGELAMASGKALVVALGGMVLPLAAGVGLGWLFIPASEVKFAQSLFVGTALSITAVPVAAAVLMQFGALRSRMGQVVISAAILDDVLSLLLLAVLTAIIKTGSMPEALELWLLGGKTVLFFAVTILPAWYARSKIERAIARFRSAEIEFSALLIAGLAYAMVAEEFGLHFILGAFLAGLLFADPAVIRQATYEGVKERLSGLTIGFLAPLFFASVGIRLEPSATWIIPGFVAVLVATAFVGKLVGAGQPAYWLGFPADEAAAIGIAMSARGAVELIIADIALRAGLFSRPTPVPAIVENMFSAVVIMAVMTTVFTPVMLKRVMRRI